MNDYRLVYYKDTPREQWDKWIHQIGGASYYHSWNWLNYMQNFDGVEKNLSFIVLNNEERPFAVCPLCITLREGLASISFGGNSCGLPALATDNARERRKMFDYIFNIIDSNVKENNVVSLDFNWHPMNNRFMKGHLLNHEDIFMPLRYDFVPVLYNTLAIDLKLPEETLAENVSKYHYRHITRAVKKGLYFIAFDFKSDSGETKAMFDQFQKAHLVSAGRLTRSQETWDAMYQAIQDKAATLFVIYRDKTPISYLFCGEFSSMAFGWSQVNVDQYEKEYSPRHFLEWQAILYYKNKRFSWYEIGERYYGPHYTEKEISISVFKERYGGLQLPKIHWKKKIK